MRILALFLVIGAGALFVSAGPNYHVIEVVMIVIALLLWVVGSFTIRRPTD